MGVRSDHAMPKKAARFPRTARLLRHADFERALGGAVQRNRMKRRLREAVRMTRPASGVAADVVINPKKSLLTMDFAAILNEVSRAFVVIEQKLSVKQQTREN